MYKLVERHFISISIYQVLSSGGVNTKAELKAAAPIVAAEKKPGGNKAKNIKYRHLFYNKNFERLKLVSKNTGRIRTSEVKLQTSRK